MQQEHLCEIRLMDMGGRICYEDRLRFNNGILSCSIPPLPKGAYLLTINDTEEFNRVVETEKIVFNRKMYLQPIPDHEMRKTQNLVQNPGW